MAKKTNKSPAKPAPVAPEGVDAEVAKRITDLKTEGNNSFARGDFGKALSVYDDAIKLLPGGAPERVDFHNNKAACFIGQKRYKEAVRECSLALEVNPSNLRALQRRAKAYEQQGQYKQALADVQAINASQQGTPETAEQEKRLREAAKRPASAPSNGAAAASTSTGARGSAGPRMPPNALQQQGLYTAKCQLGDETKLVHLSITNSYADVLAMVQAKFPNAGPFVLKFLDKSGDLITVTSRNDLHLALQELVVQYQRAVQANAGGHGPKLTAFPPLKLVLTPVASQADVPAPPAEEELERQQVLAQQRAALAAAAGKSAEAAPEAAPVQVDPWLVEFAQLFMQTTGLEPDKHVELNALGWEALQKGLDNTLHSAEAEPLFDKAKDSFRDSACAGLTGWGQVHQLLGTRTLEAAAKAGKELAEVKDSVLAAWSDAEKRYREALAYNADFFDAVCNMSQLEFERCKVAAGLMTAPPSDAKPEGDASSSGKDEAKEQMDAMNAAARALLDKLKPEAVKAAKAQYEASQVWADKAVALAPAMDAKTKEQQAKVAEAGQVAPAQPEYDFKSQALVLKGNFVYEWSQMLAAVGDEWRSVLDGAVALFREAKCPEKDIRQALRNHYRAAELDIPAEEPEEQPAAPAAPAAPAKAEPAEEKPKAKGLPSLEVKKAKK